MFLNQSRKTSLQPCILDITIISAQHLKKASAIFSNRIRPFVSISTTIPTSSSKSMKMYRTRVDEEGSINPTWGDMFQISLDPTFFHKKYPGIYLQLCTKHLLMGQSTLGWCLIPVTDIVNRFTPLGSTRFLSYRIRDKDGVRGNGVINVAVTLKGLIMTVHPPRTLISNAQHYPGMYGTDGTVIGIPVTGNFLLGRAILTNVAFHVKFSAFD